MYTLCVPRLFVRYLSLKEPVEIGPYLTRESRVHKAGRVVRFRVIILTISIRLGALIEWVRASAGGRVRI